MKKILIQKVQDNEKKILFSWLQKFNQFNLNRTRAYQFFLKGIVFLLLIGQLWVNVAIHCSWIVDADSERIEFSYADNSEEDNKKEKDDKISVDSYTKRSDDFEKIIDILYLEELLPTFHPEITTPPPKAFFFLT